ncbi:MAG: hypothetical protein WA813_23305, partial [Beijerinckiaceae bacterium]
AGHFAHDHRLVGGAQVELRGDRHLILAGRIFGEEGVGRRARPADRGDEDFAEPPLMAEGIIAIEQFDFGKAITKTEPASDPPKVEKN